MQRSLKQADPESAKIHFEKHFKFELEDTHHVKVKIERAVVLCATEDNPTNVRTLLNAVRLLDSFVPLNECMETLLGYLDDAISICDTLETGSLSREKIALLAMKSKVLQDCEAESSLDCLGDALAYHRRNKNVANDSTCVLLQQLIEKHPEYIKENLHDGKKSIIKKVRFFIHSDRRSRGYTEPFDEIPALMLDSAPLFRRQRRRNSTT